MSESTNNRTVMFGTATKLAFTKLFWWLALFVTPIALSPGAIAGSLSALRETASFRGILLGLTVFLGAFSYLAVSPMHFSDIVKSRTLRQPWLVALFLLVGWILLSTLYPKSAPVEPSLGSKSRIDGTLPQAGWFLLTAVSFAIARHSRVRESTLVHLIVGSGIVTSVWAYLQALRLDPLTLIAGLYLDIPAGAFGHGALASAYISFVALIAASTWSSQKQIGVANFMAFLVLGLGLASSGGRAALAGLLVGALLLLLVSAVKRGTGLIRLCAWGTAFVIGMFLPLATVERAQARVDQTAAAFVGQDANLNTRIAAWIGGSRLLLANPVFGVGPGGFGVEVWNFLEHERIETMLRDPLGPQLAGVDLNEGDYVISGDVVAFFDASGSPVVSQIGWDKAHNYLIDLGLMFGMPAIALFLVFVIAGQFALWRGGSTFTEGVAVGWVSFIVFGFAWFGTISLDPVVWAMVGAGIGISLRTRERSRTLDNPLILSPTGA